MNQELIDLGDKIRAARKAHPDRLSQSALAERVGVHRDTIIDIEYGRRNASYPLICAIKKLLEIE